MIPAMLFEAKRFTGRVNKLTLAKCLGLKSSAPHHDTWISSFLFVGLEEAWAAQAGGVFLMWRGSNVASSEPSFVKPSDLESQH